MKKEIASVLVTGGAGFIGSATVRALLRRGHHVVVLDAFVPGLGFKEAIPFDDRVEVVEGDIGDSSLLARVCARYNINAVVHCAALIDAAESVQHAREYHDVNFVRTRRLVETIAESGVTYFVFASSAAVYGTTDVSGPIPESVSLRPDSPYGESKRDVEQFLAEFDVSGFQYVALRYFNTAGADMRIPEGNHKLNPQHLIGRAVLASLGVIEGFKLFGSDYPTQDGTCTRDYVHVLDLAEANVLALEYLARGGKSLTANIGGGESVSNLRVIQLVGEIAGEDIPYEIADRRPGDIGESAADIRVATGRIGFHPTRSIREIIEDEFAWQRLLRKKL